jgi:sarcosine oxidase / L-pipecolate oxidase
VLVCANFLLPASLLIIPRDAVTPNQDWVIDSHPKCKNLYIAGGGSFHSWKFLPTVGAYVVQKLAGTLDEEKSARWAWDREDSGGACIMYIPTRDVKNIGPFKGWPKVTVKVQ